jgi:O-antigen/teichoic acid export membrane protein
LYRGIAGSFLAKSTTVLAPLVVTPLALSSLGLPVFGLWMAVLSITGMIVFADLGLGNGLMTRLAARRHLDEWRVDRRYISTAYVMLTLLAAIVCLMLWTSAAIAPWTAMLGVGPEIPADTTALLACTCLSLFVINIPLSLITRIQYANQMVWQNSLWQAGGALLAIPLVWLTVRLDGSPVAVVAAATVGVPLANCVNSMRYFRGERSRLRPRWRYFDRAAFRQLTGLGSQFFIISLIMAIALNLDNVIVAHRLGLASVATYAVVARLFAQFGQVVTLINTPLWPANGEALMRGDVTWVIRATRRMQVISIAATAACLLPLVLGGNDLLYRWLGVDISAQPVFLLGLMAWWLMLAGTSALFMVQNSAGILRPQLIGWAAFLLLSASMRWWLVGRYGTWVLPWTTLGCYAVTVVPSAIVGFRFALRSGGRGRGL